MKITVEILQAVIKWAAKYQISFIFNEECNQYYFLYHGKKHVVGEVTVLGCYDLAKAC